MVYFICNNCGDSLKKQQVDQHLVKPRCRGCSVSCMDCHRDFDSKSYVHHNKCISEQEKYSGGNFTQKASQINKEGKRNQWCILINEVANRRDPQRPQNVQNMLDFMSGIETVPKKEKAFLNFMNTFPRHIKNYQAAEAVWKLLMEETQKGGKQKEQISKNTSTTPVEPTPPAKKPAKKVKSVKDLNGTEKIGGDTVLTHEFATPDVWKKAIKQLSKREGDYAEIYQALSLLDDVPTGPKKTFKKYLRKNVPQAHHAAVIWSALNDECIKIAGKTNKRSLPDENTNGKIKRAKLNGDASDHAEVATNGGFKSAKFPWKKSVLRVLESSKDNTMSLKKLKKKVFAEYESLGLDSSDQEKLETKLSQALGKIPNSAIIKKENKDVVMLVTEN